MGTLLYTSQVNTCCCDLEQSSAKRKIIPASQGEDKENHTDEDGAPSSGTQDGSEADALMKKKQGLVKPAKEYIPAVGTANYAFLIVMYRASWCNWHMQL